MGQLLDPPDPVPASVPEPASLALLMGALGVVWRWRSA